MIPFRKLAIFISLCVKGYIEFFFFKLLSFFTPFFCVVYHNNRDERNNILTDNRSVSAKIKVQNPHHKPNTCVITEARTPLNTTTCAYGNTQRWTVRFEFLWLKTVPMFKRYIFLFLYVACGYGFRTCFKVGIRKCCSAAVVLHIYTQHRILWYIYIYIYDSNIVHSTPFNNVLLR